MMGLLLWVFYCAVTSTADQPLITYDQKNNAYTQIKEILEKGSLNDFEKYKEWLSHFDDCELFALQLKRKDRRKACVVVHKWFTIPGLYELTLSMEKTITEMPREPNCSARYAFLKWEHKKIEEQKRAGISIDSLRKQALEFVENKGNGSLVLPYVFMLKKKVMALPREERKQFFIDEFAHLEAIKGAVKQEQKLWVPSEYGTDESGRPWFRTRKLKPGEVREVPSWERIDDEESTQEDDWIAQTDFIGISELMEQR